MGLPRSTFYDAPSVRLDDAEIVDRMQTICDEFEAYGYRRVGAELRHHGVIVNHKKIRRLMREHGLQPKRRRRYVATTDSNHDSPIFPNRTRDRVVDGPNQLWVADITYIAITGGFVYLAAILDAWSRRVGGYAISRSIDARLAAAALKAAVQARSPPEGCVHHSDRGSQCQGVERKHRELKSHGFGKQDRIMQKISRCVRDRLEEVGSARQSLDPDCRQALPPPLHPQHAGRNCNDDGHEDCHHDEEGGICPVV